MLKVDIPEGISGNWRVEKFTVTEEDVRYFNMRGAFSGRGGHIKAGSYTRLMRGSTVVMSDTPDEMRGHEMFVRKATGNVLINGLGIGMVLKNVLAKEDVKSVVVNELSEDVIELVAPYYKDDRLTINHVSAFNYKPPKGLKFDAIWHDIWDYICTDNLEEMKKLHRKYGRYCTGYQGSWERSRLEYELKKQQREDKRWGRPLWAR